MNQFKRNIDLNLLVCLDALLVEGSVTRAAERLNMSQPGVSHALSRLRLLTGDALFIRTGKEFIPTERARSLAEKVRSSLTVLEDIFSEEGPFDPESTAGTLTVAAADSVSIMIAPLLSDALARQAPLIKLQLRLPDANKLRQWLSEGECDLAIGYFTDPSPDLRSGDLFGQALSCISGPKHPLLGKSFGLEDYLASSHVVFGSPFGTPSPMENSIDETLAKLGKQRRRAVEVASMLMVSYVVAGSTHVAALPGRLARQCASSLPLEVRPLPFDVPPIVIRMLWHERTHRLGLHRWVRSVIRSLVEELAGSDGILSIAPISADGGVFYKPPG